MSLGFVLGTAAKDHQTKLLDQLATDMAAHPNDQFYYLVPNHIKFESEINVLDELAKRQHISPDSSYAQTKLQIFSFSRLAWYLLKNTAAYQATRLSATGLNMLVFQIISDHQGELRLFAGEYNHPGFINELTSQLEELKQACISAQDLAQLANKLSDAGNDLTAKLHDLVLVYTHYEQAVDGQYLGNSEIYDQLAQYLSEQNLSTAHFYLDRFSQFTANEQEIVTALIHNAQSVLISLPLDRAYKDGTPEINDLFFEAGSVYHRLYQQTKDHATDQWATAIRVSPDLAQLDRFLIADTKMALIDRSSTETPTAIKIFTADSQLTELQQVARQIRQLVASGKYRYRDFLVLTRHLDGYAPALEPVFRQNNIPVFNDHERSMDDHPLVELLNALFAVKQHYYRYADLMRLLKTELLIPQIDGMATSVTQFRQALAITENWLLKTGYHGDDWLAETDWQYYRFRDTDTGVQSDKIMTATKEINLIRHFVKAILPSFFTALDNAKTGREAAGILYQFLTDQNVEQQLINWRDRQIELGDLEQAGEPEQVWQTFCDLLDEYVTILGDRPFNPDDFQAILQTGFGAATYSQIPSTLDQVVVSETGIVQSNRRKITFMIGATDQVMPDAPTERSLLSDQDRDKIKKYLKDDQYLAADSMEQLANDPFVNYLGFMSGCEQLYLSYPRLGETGQEVKESQYVAAIRTFFELAVQDYQQAPTLTDQQVTPFVSAPNATISALVQIERQAKEQRTALAPIWDYIYQQLQQLPASSAKLKTVMRSLAYSNVPVKLKPAIISGLYGDTINTSVSKLEEFYQNEYAYFLKFGLKLRERDMFELSNADTGQFFHESLDQLIKRIQALNIPLDKLSPEQVASLVNQVVANVSQDPQFIILASSARMKYIAGQLGATIQQMGQALYEQSKQTAMRPFKTEVLFGQIQDQTGLAALQFKLSNNKQVNVRGKIDRIDQLTTPQGDYLGIVDYKSGKKDFKISDAYYGLAMQMLTYLNAVELNHEQLEAAPNSKLAGALYMHIFNPKIPQKDVVKGLAHAKLAANKYKGLLLDDPELLGHLDTGNSGWSEVYPFQRKKDGSFKSNQLMTAAQLEMLLERNRERIRYAAEQIFAGADALNPVKWDEKSTALQFSPYKDVFQFDAMLPDNNYRQLQKLSKEEVFALLKGEAK